MATAVFDLDLIQLPETDFDLPSYQKAYVLIRFKGVPIGRTTIPLRDGKLGVQECYSQMMKAVKHNYWKHWVNDYLGWDERKEISFQPPTATIAICTRNRTDDLKRCLDALDTLPDDGQEILVIDNCPSTDSTQQLVATYPAVRYVLEPVPGLDNARNRALLEAKHEIIAFIDDDAVPDNNWLRAILINFNNPNVMCVTGLTMPVELETEAQEAFEQYSPFCKGFQRKVFTRPTISTGRIGAGANMAFRKIMVEKIGLFDKDLDAGTPTQSGGDHEMFARILLAGYHIIYDPAALNWHRHRRTREELVKAIYGYGVGVYSLYTRHLLLNYEFSVLRHAFGWFWYVQLPNLLKALFRRPGAPPLALVTAELRGCLAGPGAYLRSRKSRRAH